MIELAVALRLAEKHFPDAPEAIARLLGVKVAFCELDPETSGWCVRRGLAAIIRINSTQPRGRQRFTLAHELAHLIQGTHPHVVETRHRGLSEIRSEVEKPANGLAAQILLPLSHLKRLTPEPPLIDAPALEKIAEVTGVTTTMAACRVADLAVELGLHNAAVFAFTPDGKRRWGWPKTLTVTDDWAEALLAGAKASAPATYVLRVPGGEDVCVASFLDDPHTQIVFAQFLPPQIGLTATAAERLRLLDSYLFADDYQFRCQLNGCLGSFREKVDLGALSTPDALKRFNDDYGERWTGPRAAKYQSSRTQEYLRLRLDEWCNRPG